MITVSKLHSNCFLRILFYPVRFTRKLIRKGESEIQNKNPNTK